MPAMMMRIAVDSSLTVRHAIKRPLSQTLPAVVDLITQEPNFHSREPMLGKIVGIVMILRGGFPMCSWIILVSMAHLVWFAMKTFTKGDLVGTVLNATTSPPF